MSDLLPLFEEQRVEVTSWPDRPRMLMSYAYIEDEDMDQLRSNRMDLIVDSGAFTVANSGGVIDHDAYLEWLAEHHDLISFALSLDVIGDHRMSVANHERAVETIGDRVQMVPAWHFGSRFSELADLCRTYPLVSIGGAVPFARQPRALFTAAAQAHRVAAEYGTKLHGLGMTGNRLIHRLPWYSVDSSSWLSAVRFPSLPLANRDGRIEQFEHGYPLGPHESALVTQYGGDPRVVSQKGWSLKAHAGDQSEPRRRWVLMACARSFMYVESAKNTAQPLAPLLMYLSGSLRSLGGQSAVVSDAWRMGNPWTAPTPLNPADWT